MACSTTKRWISDLLNRDSARPCCLGNSHAIALTCATSCGGKTARATRPRSILKTLDALNGKPFSPVRDPVGRHVHPRSDLTIGAPVGGQQHQLRADHNPIGQRQAARPPLKLTTGLLIKLDRCRRHSHAITFVNLTATPSAARQNFRPAALSHDLHALAWAIELHRLAGDLATDHWRTARYATGRYPVPQIGRDRERHAITLNELPLPDGQAIIDLQQGAFTEVKPDLSLELHIPSMRLTFDLLVEVDLTARPAYNHDKFLAYDAFLCGWSLAHRRYHTQGTRPAVVFVCPDPRGTLILAREADEAMTGRIGVMGTTPEHWYFPGRDHVFFTTEADLHHHDLTALALPGRPPGLRQRLSDTRELRVERVQLLPDTLLADGDPRSRR
jgi:hypothetical protein